MQIKKFPIHVTVEQINDVLPQTQCTLCSYDGCQPYANAIVHEHETIDRCPPGGVKGLLKLAELTGQHALPYLDEMERKQKSPSIAVIREDICIGCTKCIQACPVDAIMGAAKQMHTVLTDECTGCELCVEPCPVDCIDIVKIDPLSDQEQKKKAQYYRARYEFREKRLAKETRRSQQKYQVAKNAYAQNKTHSIDEKKRLIAEALARVKAKRHE